MVISLTLFSPTALPRHELTFYYWNYICKSQHAGWRSSPWFCTAQSVNVSAYVFHSSWIWPRTRLSPVDWENRDSRFNMQQHLSLPEIKTCSSFLLIENRSMAILRLERVMDLFPWQSKLKPLTLWSKFTFQAKDRKRSLSVIYFTIYHFTRTCWDSDLTSLLFN